MKLKNLLLGLENLKLKGDLELEINGIESNSKQVKPGYLFVAIKGFSETIHVFNNWFFCSSLSTLTSVIRWIVVLFFIKWTQFP